MPALLLHWPLISELSGDDAVDDAPYARSLRVRVIEPARSQAMTWARVPVLAFFDAAPPTPPTAQTRSTLESKQAQALQPTNAALSGSAAGTPDDASASTVLVAFEEAAWQSPAAEAAAEQDVNSDVWSANNQPGLINAALPLDDELLASARTWTVADSRPPGSTDDDGSAVPVYSTAPAPSQILRFDLQRGMLGGTAELDWQRDPPGQPGAGFELQLRAKVGGLTIMTQISRGSFDKAGLAPVRFTDQRLRGTVRAVNFQRQRGIISFSGPSVEFALVHGAQDRLSWMIQVPAILAANPKLATPGQQLTVYVVGARGDASAWIFRCESVDSVKTDRTVVKAVKFVRESRKPHDTQAEVWLDPARNYLPVRARIGNPDDGAMLELLRQTD